MYWCCVEIRASPMQGFGAFARAGIPEGVRLIEYAGERITPAEAETMPRPTGFMASWVTRALSAEPSTPALETTMPAAIEKIGRAHV